MSAKDRGTRSAAPSASPAPTTSRSSRSRSGKTADSASTEDSTVDSVDEATENEDEDTIEEAGETVEEEVEAEEEAAVEDSGKLSMADRLAKMKELRGRMVCQISLFGISPMICIPLFKLTIRTNQQQRIVATSLQTIRNPK